MSKSIYLIRTIKSTKNNLYHTIACITDELDEADIRHLENIIKMSLGEVAISDNSRVAFKGIVIEKLMHAFPEQIVREDINEEKYRYWVCYK